MTYFEAVFLGIIQGVTEFLPISSSGHLVVVPLIFKWQPQSMAFDLMLHFGTLLALLIYFKNDLFAIFLALISDFYSNGLHLDKYSKYGRLGLYAILAAFPAALVGVLFEGLIEEQFRSLLSVAIIMTLGTLFMVFCETVKITRFGQNLNAGNAFVIGLAQVFSLFPGFSRSGSTISAGILCGLNREEAARFSFLLAIPIIGGATVLKFTDLLLDGAILGYDVIALGFLSSFFSGIFMVSFLMKFLRNNSLRVFIIYRFLFVTFLFSLYFLL